MRGGGGIGVIDDGGDLVGGAVAGAAVGPGMHEFCFIGAGGVGEGDGGVSVRVRG